MNPPSVAALHDSEQKTFHKYNLDFKSGFDSNQEINLYLKLQFFAHKCLPGHKSSQVTSFSQNFHTSDADEPR